MKNKRIQKITFVIISAALLLGSLIYLLWRGGFFLPRWIQWTSADFRDETGSYRITLRHGALRVSYRDADLPEGSDSQDDAGIWSPPKDVKVQKVLSFDVDNDLQEELVLLCWRIGRYGNARPFWVTENEQTWSQHIFVYEYAQGDIRPKWMSSYIGRDIADISPYRRADSRSRLLLTDSEGEVTVWLWDSWGFTLENASVSFLALGDNLIHEPLYRYGLQNGDNFDFLFENLREEIIASDVAVINQETPLVEDPALYSDYPRFGTPIGVGESIADAGFDIVTCATNHALDKGTEGIHTTKDFFDSRNVICLGIQTPEETEYQPWKIMTKKGIRFALLNYTYGTNGIEIPESSPYLVHLLDDPDKITRDIESARADADFVILFVHWGTEDSTRVNDAQRKWTQVFLDAGADVVIGTHPHALQPYELLTAADGHEMLVYYSIGNYISAQPAPTCTKGGMAEFTVSPTASGYKITEYSLTPLAITWQEGGKCTVDYALTPNPAPDNLSSNASSGTGLE